MKRIVWFLILGVLISNLHAQNEWAPVGAEWYYTETWASFHDTGFIKLESVQDTIIESVPCKRLRRNRSTCTERPDNDYIYERNDSVFYFDEVTSEFKLLYDFSAKQNDSWKIVVSDDIPNQDTIAVAVDSIGIEEIKDISLKVLFVTYSPNNPDKYEPINDKSRIIEKLGDMHYFFPWVSGVCDFNFAGPLRCYEDDTLGLHNTGVSPSCTYTVTDMPDIERGQNANIYLNPTLNTIQIELAGGSLIRTIRVLTLSGQCIQSLQDVNTSSYAFKLGHIPKGLYLIEVNTADNKYTLNKKILIQ